MEEEVRALNNVSLDEDSEFYPVKRGEFVIIRGPSGGGKTTLLNILGTLDSDFDGELYIMNSANWFQYLVSNGIFRSLSVYYGIFIIVCF